ncbi:Translational activator GCN1 [Galdieria sulphuraria]|nr:Translational activator GCN1 [Galdieria sulphuraria]
MESILDSLWKRWNSTDSASYSRQSKCTVLQCLQVLSGYDECSEDQSWMNTIFSHLFESLKGSRYGNPQVISGIYDCLSSWLYRHRISEEQGKSLIQWILDTWDSKHKEDQIEWTSLLSMLFYGFLSPKSKNWNIVSSDILQALGFKLCQRKKGAFPLKHDNLLCCLVLMGIWFALKQQSEENNNQMLDNIEKWILSCYGSALAVVSWERYSEQLLGIMSELCNYALIDFSLWASLPQNVCDLILRCLSRLILDPSTNYTLQKDSIRVVQRVVEMSKEVRYHQGFQIILHRLFWCCMEYELNSHYNHIDGTFLYWYPSQAWQSEAERKAVETLITNTFHSVCECLMEAVPVSSFFLFVSTQTAITRASKWWYRIHRHCKSTFPPDIVQGIDFKRVTVEELKGKQGIANEQRMIGHCGAYALASFTLFLPRDVVHSWIWESLFEMCFSSLRFCSTIDYQVFVECLPILSHSSDEIRELQSELESLRQQLSSDKKASIERKKSQVASRNKQQVQAELDKQKTIMEKRMEEIEERLSRVQLAKKTEKFLKQAETALSYIVGLNPYLDCLKDQLKEHISNVMDWIPILIQYGVLRNLVLSTVMICCKVCGNSIAKRANHIARAFEECVWKRNKFEWLDAFSSEQLSLESFCIFYPLFEATLEAHSNERNLIRNVLEILQLHLQTNPSIALYCSNKNKFAKLLYTILEREDSNFNIASSCLGEWSEKGKSSVRGAALDAIARLPILTMYAQQPSVANDTQDVLLCRFLWLSCHDPEEENALVAQHLFHLYNGKTFLEDYVAEYIKLLSHAEQDIRSAAAHAMAHLLQNNNDLEEEFLKIQWNKKKSQFLAQLFSLYVENLEPKEAEKNPPSEEQPRDSYWKRQKNLLSFLRSLLLEVLEISMISCVSSLLSLVEKQLSKDIDAANQPNDRVQLHVQDLTKEGLVVSLGTLAQHLSDNDPRIETSMEWLMKLCLETPSEPVQMRVRDCLSSLALKARTKSLELGTRLFKELVENNSYGARRGAAYALTGLLKGIGLGSLSEMGILDSLFCRLDQQKFDLKAKQGRLFLLEVLSKSFKGVMDPYVMETLPFLLSCSGDTSTEVREACFTTAKALMSSISGICVRIVLPSLLKGLEDRSWRVKVASCEMLGTMAYCAPRQLAECLPQIVPKLSDALIDSHPKVVETAEASLYRIASVTKNPEVRDLSSFIMEALKNPATKTNAALDAMMATEFTHVVDAASISLLIPVLHRGLRERSTEVKKKAALILGSMCSQIASPKDMEPYLDLLLPSILSVLLDPIPDARAAAARALGYFARGVGTANVGGLSEKLVEMSQNGKSSAERLGAAMGLAEISTAANSEELEWIVRESLKPYKVYLELQEMKKKRSGITVSQREGTFLVLATLALTLVKSFEKYIPVILPVVLEGFGDESDTVREAALNAGHYLVSVFSTSSFEMLIPLLIGGLKHKNWRRRQASAQLLGALLFSILGYENTQKSQIMGSFGSQNNENEPSEDEEEELILNEERKTRTLQEKADIASFMTSEREKQQIEKLDSVLGIQRRRKIFTLLFIANRGDVNGKVRSSASAVWKALVSNTPKNIRELLPLIIEELVEELSVDAEDLHERACDTLTDLIQRLGNLLMPELLPLLEKNFSVPSVVTRHSVSDGLLHIVESCSKQLLLNNTEPLLKLTLCILKDGENNIRRNGAATFVHLYKATGDASLEAIYPQLLQLMQDSATQELGFNAFENLLEVGGTRLVQWIVGNMIDSSYLVTGGMAQVFACAVRHSQGCIATISITKVADKLIHICEESEVSREQQDCVIELESALLCIIEAMNCSSSYISTLGNRWRFILEKDPTKKAVCLYLMGLLGTVILPVEDWQDALFSSMLTTVIQHLDSRDDRILQICIRALDQMLKLDSRDRKQQLIRFLSTIRKAFTPVTVRSLDKHTSLRGISSPFSPAALMNLCMEGLVNGDISIKHEATRTIQLIVKYSDSKALSPLIIKVVGALIRLSSERHAAAIKASIMRSFYEILEKRCMEVKVFVPQLQSVLTKSLADTQNNATRHFAAKSLGWLVRTFSSVRWDVLWGELFHLLENDVSLDIRLSGLYAIQNVFSQGPNEKFASWNLIESNLLPYLSSSSEKQFILRLSMVLGIWAQSIYERDPVLVFKLLASLLSSIQGNMLPLCAGLAISEVFKGILKTQSVVGNSHQRDLPKISHDSTLSQLFQYLIQGCENESQSQRVLCSRIGILYLDFLHHLQVQGCETLELEMKLWQVIAKLQRDSSEQVRSEVITAIRWISNKSLLERMIPWVIQTMKRSSLSNELYAGEQTLRKLYHEGILSTLSLSEEEKAWMGNNEARLQLAVQGDENSSEEEFEFGKE